MPTLAELMETMDYAPAPEDSGVALDWIAKTKRFGHFINGAFTDPEACFETLNPATGAVLAEISQGSAETVEKAVEAARKAQPKWAALSGQDRAQHLYALARHIQQHARLLSVLETLDNGKPIRESRDIDIPLVARHFYHHAGWAAMLEDEFPGHVAHGVCGQIIPWNFPLLMLAWKVAPALAAGNTVVLKPAEYTPLTALAFAQIVQEVGLPKGVVNIVTGDGETGSALVTNGDVDKIAFTGSTEVGRLIRQQTAGSGKALTLELGGKSPFVVFADADLDAAVEGVVDAIWFNQGQVCCAGSRILVDEAAAPTFTARLKTRMAKLRVGDPLDKCTDVGAIVHPTQLERITSLVRKGVSEGAVLTQSEAPDGCFFPPTLAENIDPASTLATEEIFGPVATITTFRTPTEAVQLANNTRYGLAASIWSENISVALDIAAQIKAGVVWINGTNMFDAAAGFGGYRESGFGREGGREGMAAYLRAPKLKGKQEPAPKPLLPLPFEAQTDGIDRTGKLYIGGKQSRPDGGYSAMASGSRGPVGLAPVGNRKDIRNAVEAAHKAVGWSKSTGHSRAQVLYFLAENFSARGAEFADRLASFGANKAAADREVQTAIARVFTYAAWADKYDGAVHNTQSAHVTLAMNEPLGVMGIACPDRWPLLGFLSLILPAIAMGNTVVAIPSQSTPLCATDLFQVFDTSDLPAGVVNIVTGDRDALTKTLAEHDDVAGLWYFGSADGVAMVERASSGNLKQTWTEIAGARDFSKSEGQGRLFLSRSTQVKNIWVPYGA